ncbi:cytochrome C [Campylobacter jejuni]|nr:cytochrome C [Campylobacter jejuni]
MQNQSGFVGIWARFPQYNARGDKVITLADRINGCFERSMNGKRMPSDTPKMKAMLTYMQWLSQGVPVGAKIEG